MKNKVGILMFIFLLSTKLYAQQDPIVGRYNYWRMSVTFKNEGTFHISATNSWRFPFSGKWERINDSTVLAKSDTLISLRFEDSIFIDKMYCRLSMKNNGEVLDIDLLFSNKSWYWYDYARTAYFYSDNSIKREIAYTTNQNYFEVITNYFPNGMIESIICYEDNVKHGVSLKYHQDGRLDQYQKWDKGKLKEEEKFVYKDTKDSLSHFNKNKQTAYSKLKGRWITTYYPNRSVHTITQYNKCAKNGVYFEYNTDNYLTLYQIWRRGKLKGSSAFWNSEIYY